jgi:hypothetical protein
MQNKPIEIRLKGEEPSALASMNEEFEDPIIRERNVKITCNATGGAQLHSSRIIGETEFLMTKGNNKSKERPIKNRTGNGKTKFSPRQILNFAARRKKVLLVAPR